jgi:RNA polymerase sigma-70 factor (sigma-E family)
MARWEAPESFAEYVRDRHAELLRFAHVLTGDRHLAEDLVQDALERAGMAWRRIRAQDEPEGYVRRIIVNRYLSRLRSLRRELLVADLPERGRHDGEPLDGAVWRALSGLPPRQRAVLVARFYLDLSEAQTAELLGCGTGTVKSQTSRALAKLRQMLDSTELARHSVGGGPR